MVKPKVSFLCTGNTCRTQMAEAFLRDLAGDWFRIFSAGAEAASIVPYAVEAMREVGIDVSDQRAKKVDPFLRERFNFLITLCDREKAVRIYGIEESRKFLVAEGIDVDAVAPQVEGKFLSAFIRAVKPAKAACCAPGCCS